MPDKVLTVCVDANVFFSAIAFGGKPQEIVEALLARRFVHVTSAIILEETRRNLHSKLGLAGPMAETALELILGVSTVALPQGSMDASVHAPDNLVLETALMGGCDVLVTGDKKHLIPLNPYQGLAIESPAVFLERLKEKS